MLLRKDHLLQVRVLDGEIWKTKLKKKMAEMENRGLILTSPAPVDSAAAQNVARPCLASMGRTCIGVGRNLVAGRDPSKVGTNKSTHVTRDEWGILTMGEEAGMPKDESYNSTMSMQ